MDNKTTHGGPRNGAGRPSSPYLERSIKIRCTAAEYRNIIGETEPRQRVEILVEWLRNLSERTPESIGADRT